MFGDGLTFQVLIAQESEAKESFEQLEMLQRTHDKLRAKAEGLEAVHDKLFNELEVVKKTLMVMTCAAGFCLFHELVRRSG